MSLSGQPPPSDSYRSVNMPAVVGAIVVFLALVIVWVIVANNDDSETSAPTTLDTTTTTVPAAVTLGSTPAPSTSAATTTTTTTSTSVPGTTTPATTTPATTAAETTVPSTSVPPTTQATTTTEPSSSDRGEGDLGVAGTPISEPECNGGYITIVASALGGQVDAAAMGEALDQFPEANYLLTEESCKSFARADDGEPIYVIFYGPFKELDDACDARSRGGSDAYPKVLTNGHGPNRGVTCDDQGGDDDDDDDD